MAVAIVTVPLDGVANDRGHFHGVAGQGCIAHERHFGTGSAGELSDSGVIGRDDDGIEETALFGNLNRMYNERCAVE
jgi:hypothetical protein